MDLYDEAYLNLWRLLYEHQVRYILVGGVATNLHGYQRYTGDVDIYIDDTIENRRRLRMAYKAYCKIDFEGFETIQFVPGWVSFPLHNGVQLDIMTSMVGIDENFEQCLQAARTAQIRGISIPVLNINHLIANKKAVARPKDRLDVLYLEKIQALRQNQTPDEI